MIALVFAALSYGAGHLMLIAQNAGRHDCLYWLSVIVGLLAGAALVVSFVAAMARSRIKSVFVPETSGFAKRIRDPAFWNADHARILLAMSTNLLDAIKKNLEQQDTEAARTGLLNWLPQFGFVCSAIFVAMTVAQSIALPSVTGHPPSGAQCIVCLQEEKTMQQEDEGKQREKDEADNGKQDSTDEVVQDLVRPAREVKGDSKSKVEKQGG